MNAPDRPLRILILGATGTVGRATAAAVATRGHMPICLSRREADLPGRLCKGDATDPATLSRLMTTERPDAVISCLASRTGRPSDAWAVDHQATCDAIAAARAAGIPRFALLSAICVQRPRLAFQHAKLAAEATLAASGLDYAIVRPTALFKSLSGQVARVVAGKSWLLFGDGRLTACTPISDADLAAYLVTCAETPPNRICPVGGPGPAQTPRDMAQTLFRLLDRPPRYRRVPVSLISGLAGGLGLAGRVSRRAADKAELARIGQYYATQSMLVLTPDGYSAAATPSTGTDTLETHYTRLLAGETTTDLGAHAVF